MTLQDLAHRVMGGEFTDQDESKEAWVAFWMKRMDASEREASEQFDAYVNARMQLWGETLEQATRSISRSRLDRPHGAFPGPRR